MSLPLSNSAKRAQKALDAFGMRLEVMELQTSTRTAADAAESIGCDVAQIAKSLVFQTKESARAILIIASGVNRVNEKKIWTLIGEEIIRPDADFVRAATGFAIGGIPPVGHPEPLQTIIDEDLFKYDTLWAAAGTPLSVFRLTPHELKTITRGTVVGVV